jgi:hypothetical protein
MTQQASTTIALPDDLAPELVARTLQLLAGVTATSAPPLIIDLTSRGPRCVVCHQRGKVGGHHGDDGQIEWVHRSCHRRLHRRGQPSRAELRRLRGLQAIEHRAAS